MIKRIVLTVAVALSLTGVGVAIGTHADGFDQRREAVVVHVDGAATTGAQAQDTVIVVQDHAHFFPFGLLFFGLLFVAVLSLVRGRRRHPGRGMHGSGPPWAAGGRGSCDRGNPSTPEGTPEAGAEPA